MEGKGEGGGRAVQVVKINDEDEEHSFTLDENALSQILNRPDVRDKPICVVSVAGAFRKGKSFLLNFMLRYLKAGGSDDWLESEEELNGFHWRGGSERDTTGILMWSEVFPVRTPDGKEVVIALIDTQGSFDKNSTVRDCATIFALSLMTSSVLVYNIFNNIQEDDLQHLHYFTEYGRLALDDSGDTPFQRLQFLVRDWQYAYEEPFGEKGGQNILDKQLKINEKQHTELQALRTNLSSCFEKMTCFLLPHPGKHVATNPNFKGTLKDIDEEFLEHLKEFMSMLLSPRRLVLKELGGKPVKAKEIVTYFKAYMEIFKGNTMPEPKSMLEVTIEVNNLVSLSSAKELYMACMESLCGGERPYLNESVLELEHHRILDQAITEFDARKKMGGEEFSHKYRDQLTKELDEAFIQFKAHNDSKNIFKAANTPITLFAIWSILYIVSQFCALIMLSPISNLCNLLMWGIVITGATWAYVKYSGEFSNVGSQIEDATGWIWDNLFQVLLSKAAEQGTTFAARQAVQRMSSVNGPTSPPMSTKKTR